MVPALCGQGAVRQLEQRIVGIWRLLFQNVESGPEGPSLLQRFTQRRLIDHRAAVGVNQRKRSMMRWVILVAGVLMLAVGCQARPGRSSPLVHPEERGIPAEVQCVAPDKERNRCNKATCKADAESDCTVFVNGCINDPDGWVQGNKDAATCSRIM